VVAPLIVAALVSGIDAVGAIDAVAEARNPATEASTALVCRTANEALSIHDRRTGSFTFTIAFRFPSAARIRGAATYTATAPFTSYGRLVDRF